MKKPVKILLWIIGTIGLLVLVLNFVLWPIMQNKTKIHSPEQNVTFTQGDMRIDVFYCSPSKKDRVIFGELVPYGEVWRTGANEASTFTTNQDLEIDGQTLAAGKYTLWTIPGEDKWSIIFNKKMYGWGVKLTDQKAARDPKFDALVTEATVSKSISVTENFSITISESSEQTAVMMFAWDNVVVPVKLQKK